MIRLTLAASKASCSAALDGVMPGFYFGRALFCPLGMIHRSVLREAINKTGTLPCRIQQIVAPRGQAAAAVVGMRADSAAS